ENLELGCYLRRDWKRMASDLESVFDRFPVLGERRSQSAGTLSGGEQQMLAIGRALMSRPKLVLFDEPSLGLAPNNVQKTFEYIMEINRQGTTVLMVEQNAYAALEMCDRSFLLEAGSVTLEGKGEDMIHNPHIQNAYLGMEA
ncbi:MAG: ATP-binding cassette domain-containing protein, partial [Pseudaminobacter sp.]